MTGFAALSVGLGAVLVGCGEPSAESMGDTNPATSTGSAEGGSPTAGEAGTTGDVPGSSAGTEASATDSDATGSPDDGTTGAPPSTTGGEGPCDHDGKCDPDEDPISCPEDCEAGSGESGGTCNHNNNCDIGEDPMSCPDDCQPGPCNHNNNCDIGEDPMSCPDDCQPGPCNHNNNCDIGEDPMSCPDDCGGGSCNNNNTCDQNEDETSCPADCQWYLPNVATPDEVDPASLDPLLEAFPAPDEAMCELPERCPGPVTTFVDPWTGAHAPTQLERSRNEIVQVDARGQRAWTYFSLLALEGDADQVYATELADAMRVTLDGSTFPVESGSLNVHPARPGMWEYLSAAGEARITESGYRGIDIDAGFYDTLCFDEGTVGGFGPWLAANLSPSQMTEIEDELADRGIPGVTIDSSFDYRDHLTVDRGYATEADFGGEGRLLKIDQQWDRYVNAAVFAAMDTYLAGLQSAADAAGQGDFPVFLNRAEGDSLWTTAEKYPLMGGETFINDGNIEYPSAHRMAPYFRQGRMLGKRVWSWNFPRVLDPIVTDRIMDTVLVYVAENDASGGLLQIPDRSIKYPLCPEEEPLCDATDSEMDALWAKLGPYLTYREQIRGLLHHPGQARTLVLEMLGLPYSVWNGEAVDLGFAGLGVGALLGDYQIDYDVTGWADGDYRHRLAETPWVTQPVLDSYEWIVLAEPQFLSDGQVAMLNDYTDAGGNLLVLLYSDASCVGADQVACELKAGCRYEADTCGHVIDGLTGTPGVNLWVVNDVDVIGYRDEPASRAGYRASFDAALAGAGLPREFTSGTDLVDLGVSHGRRASDGAHVWHLINYAWNEGTYSTVPRASTTIELAVPSELQGQTVNVTWFSAPDGRVELHSGITLDAGANPTVSLTLPAFDVWGTIVISTGGHEDFVAPRARPPYVKVTSYQPGASQDWQFQFEAVSSHASLDRAYLWGRAMVETSPQEWEATGPWRAMYEYDFTEGGTVDPGRKQIVQFSIPRPSAVQRVEIYATACDADDLCQPFIPWAVMTRPPSP